MGMFTAVLKPRRGFFECLCEGMRKTPGPLPRKANAPPPGKLGNMIIRSY